MSSSARRTQFICRPPKEEKTNNNTNKRTSKLWRQTNFNMGRPTDYKKTYPKIAEKMCSMGATDQDLADAFDVSVRTIYRWKVSHKPFCQALSVAKNGYDDAIERSLAMRAMGYSHPETKINVVDGEIIRTTVNKHYPPDTKAALAWLYNRKPDRYHPLGHEAIKGNDEDIEPTKVVIQVIDASKEKK